MTKTALALTIVIGIAVASFAFAGDTWTNDSGVHGFQLTHSDQFSNDSYTLMCASLYDAATEGTTPQGMRDLVRNQLGFMAPDFDKNTVLLWCKASPQSGAPYFFPMDLGYSSGGYSYDIGFGDYQELKGSSGKLRGDVTLFYVLKGAQYDKPFTVYLADDSVKVTLPAP